VAEVSATLARIANPSCQADPFARQSFLNTFGFMELMFATDGLQPQVTSTIKYDTPPDEDHP
jgi:hypothetical protein